MTPPAETMTQLFRALSDPTRRQVLEQLTKNAASVSQLALPHDMALPSFLQHLSMLEECGLVRSKKVGRVRTYQLVPQRLRVAETWLNRQRTFWEKRLDQFDNFVTKIHKEHS